MRTVKTLIDEAAEACGGQAALARRIGVHRSQISAWKSGSEPISPESVGLLCDVLELDGDEARRLLALAVVENPKNAARAGVLRRAFFVCLALGAGLMSDHATRAWREDLTPGAIVTSLTVYTSSRIRIALQWLTRTARARRRANASAAPA